ncbi:MAG TPA: tannase/feruloyl esterase family alpha/beta hydrolase [Myxococcaceae bacterium]|nr:tannase/feruloyl esterase family alpha/beta hydrolase [Myxococcaceae bacterium]
MYKSNSIVKGLTGFCFKPVLAIALATVLSASASAASCPELADISLPSAIITSAVVIGASGAVPAHCKVNGVATPTAKSSVQFEVRLPLSAWNGKFNGIGNGGYGGTIPATDGASLIRNYATAATDMGHSSSDPVWALGHPERIADWGYRANHVTAGLAKTLIKAFYNVGPTLSYFTGCSDGGHEALMEAQRFPDDYDGIVAGASANYWTHQSVAWVWEGAALLATPIKNNQLKAITAAVMEECDAIDGLRDGIIDDPRLCNFDPAGLVSSGVLTAAQADAVRKIYEGPRNPRTGELLYPGLERGGEHGAIADDSFSQLLGSWLPLTRGEGLDPNSFGIPFLGTLFFQQMVFNDLNWDYRTLDYDADVAFADATIGPIINSTDPDLSNFKSLGGKLIMYHGWADPLVNPRNSIDYYQSVAAKLETDSFLRLFMVPGMDHCSLGTGPYVFDTLTALERWVEQGEAPDRIVATGGIVPTRTRPLCPYPQVARYQGQGSIDDAANFACVMP